MHRVYIAASTQAENIGVAGYGTEQDRMMKLADRVKYWLDTQGEKFDVFRNQPGWSLGQTCKDCNDLVCDIFIDNHSDAGNTEKTAGDGGAEGTSLFFAAGSVNGKRLADILYSYIAPVSLGKDRGSKPDTVLYNSGLYVLRNTEPPAALIEHMFHTNYQEVADMIADCDRYAKAEAKAICAYFGETWEEPEAPLSPHAWREILKKVSDSPEAWERAINTAVNAAKADGNLGDMEVFQYLPLLIEKIGGMKR